MKTMMTRRGSKVFPITVGVLGSLALAVSASGQFQRVTAQRLDAGAPECLWTWRVVAEFGGGDIMLFWGAIPGEGGGKLDFLTGFGVDLINAGGGFDGLKAEDFAAFPISREWDSWVTVGTTGFAANETDYTRGFIGSDGVTAAIVGNSFSDVDGLVFDSDPNNSPIVGPDVVMAQFTLPYGKGFHLEGIVGWHPQNDPVLNVSSFEVTVFGLPLCPWDLDGDDTVGAIDLLTLLVAWGPQRRCHPADFDCNGTVGASDLLELLVNWGPCPCDDGFVGG